VVAGQVLQSAPTTVEVKENAVNGQGDKGTRGQEEINSADVNVGAILYGRPATEDTQTQVLPSSDLQPPSPTPQPPHPDNDDDEEVSWQSAARASLEKEQKKPSALSPQPSATPQVVKQQPNISPAPLLPRSPASTTAETQPSTLNPQPSETQFTREELPTDFWGSESEPPPSSSYDDDEAFETATSAPSGNGQTGKARATPKSGAKLPFDMPLFNELQSLFPGRIVRIDVKQQKQAEESEEASAQANESVSVVESEESE
jgi:hypothetical protein